MLIAPYDGKPVVKVIDFGITKAAGQRLTEKTLFTEIGAVVGTLEYMSPEQAELNNQDIDTRSDVYSLGVLLYELLAGSTPLTRERLKETSLLEVLRAIREEEPPKPSTRLSESKDSLPAISAQRQTEPAKLRKLVRGELDWIVMKALEKDRGRRYETANGFALDVQHYLADEPVLACPPSAWYRLKKLARRQKSVLLIAGLVLFFIVLLGGVGGWMVGDRSARQAQAAVDIEVALRQTYVLQEKQHWREALEVAKHAQLLLLANNRGDEDLHSRVRQRVADLELVVKLEDARSLRTEVRDDRFAWEETADAYAQAFQEYGLDVATVNPREAGAFLRERGIGTEVAAALDDGFLFTSVGNANVPQQLLAIARAADPDPTRDELRAALAANDGKALERLTALEQITELPAATLVLKAQVAKYFLQARVAGFVDRTKWAKRVAAWLRVAQRQHPDDFWINHDLAFALASLKPPQADEAVRFYTAALALRPRSPGVYLNLAIALKAGGRLDEAIAALRQAIALKPDYAHAHNNLATNLWAKGELDEALAELREALRLRKDYFEAHSNLGGLLHERGELDEAVAECRKGIDIRKDFPHAHVNLGMALMDKGELDEAVTACREAVRLNKELPEAHSSLGSALRAKGLLDEAIREYREAIRLKNDYAEAHYGLAGSLKVKGRLDEAIAEYREAIRHKRNYAAAQNNLGVALDDKGQKDEAIDAYLKAIRMDRNFAEPHYNLGLAYMDLGRTDEAITEYREAIRLKMTDGRPHHTLGKALYKKGDLDGALAAFREALRLQKDYADTHDGVRAAKLTAAQRAEWQTSYAAVHNALGIVLRAQGKLNEAVAEYREAIRLNYDIPEAHNNLANVLSKQGLRDEAIAEYHEAICLKEDYATPYNGLGLVLRDLGRLDEAIAAWQDAIHIDKNYAKPRRNLAHALWQKHRIDEAIAEYRQAIRLDPQDHVTRNGLGVALMDKGLLDAAMAEFREAIRLNKDYAAAHNNFGNALRFKGLLDEAIAEYREAVRLAPDQKELHASLGVALRVQGHLKEAIAELREALRIDKKFAEAHTELGAALDAAGQWEEARTEFREAVRLAPKNPQVHNNLAWFLANCRDARFRDPPTAVTMAEKAVELLPTGSHWNTLGVAQYRAGNWKASAEALHKAMALTGGGTADDWFFLAMACWQQGDKEQARKWHNRANEWMKKNKEALEKEKPHQEELRRFQAEAAELIHP